MPRPLLSGNEAVARGAFEAGCLVGTAYPGTPSTEILENLAQYPGIDCEWSVNEKVALEVAFGASIAGCRSITAMKHVGLNVAADPFFLLSYEGVNGGLVVVSADDPGPNSSQNEQDNRNYALHAKMPMLEPSDSGECLTFTQEAFALSERFDLPVLLRMTTRICHGRSLVEPGDPRPPSVRPYEKNQAKYVPMPRNAARLHRALEGRLQSLAEYAETCPFNREECNGNAVGVITSGISYQYAREALGDSVSYLKLGLTNPLPERMIRSFAGKVGTLFIVEEGDAYLERGVKAMGIRCEGKARLPLCGELSAGLVARALGAVAPRPQPLAAAALPERPPVLCPGCPHRGVFWALGRYGDLMLANDIGCYTLGLALPSAPTDTCACMGGGFTLAQGFAKAKELANRDSWIVGVVGDSTFFHSGITGLINAVWNGSRMTMIVLDNSSTAMTGRQANPGTGTALSGKPAPVVSIEAFVRACGIDDLHLRLVDPFDIHEVDSALLEARASEGVFVIIAKSPCAMTGAKADPRRQFAVQSELCTGCGECLELGCPAMALGRDGAVINKLMCAGCGLCAQTCGFNAIGEFEQ